MRNIVVLIISIFITGKAYAEVNLFLSADGITFLKNNPQFVIPIGSGTGEEFFIGGTDFEICCIERKNIAVIKKYIQRISVSGSLSTYPKELEKAANVHTVEICCFDSMPANLFVCLAKYKNLETLAFSFPAEQARYTLKNIGKLRHLKHLSLVGHNLEALPAEIYMLEELETLSLVRNQLEHWPDSICRLRHLIRIDFRYNRFKSVPEQGHFSCLPELRYVDFSKNKIESLPDWAKDLKPIISIQ